MINISVRATTFEKPSEYNGHRAVAVIDVLRATSVMATALHHGANAIYTKSHIPEAIQLKTILGGNVLLCGERQAKRIEGFDLGNSPFEFSAKTIKGKTIIMCTTNGTRAIESAKNTATLIIALSFINLSAAARLLLHANMPVELLCAGTNGRFSLDDALCAGMTIDWLSKHTEVVTDDLGLLLLDFARKPGVVEQKLQHCAHKKYLESVGYGADVAYCFTQDLIKTVPVFKTDGYFVAEMI